MRGIRHHQPGLLLGLELSSLWWWMLEKKLNLPGKERQHQSRNPNKTPDPLVQVNKVRSTICRVAECRTLVFKNKVQVLMIKARRKRGLAVSQVCHSHFRSPLKSLYIMSTSESRLCNNFLKILLEGDTFKQEQIKRICCEARQEVESSSVKKTLKNLACLSFKNKNWDEALSL